MPSPGVDAGDGKWTRDDDRGRGDERPSRHVDGAPRQKERKREAHRSRQRERGQIPRGRGVDDRVRKRTARGSQDRPRQRRGEDERDRHVDGDVRDEDGVGRPRDPRPLQSPPQTKEDRKEQERNQDVLPQVGDGGPERERDLSAAGTAEEDQRPGGQEDREQAERSQRVTRFRRLSSSHDTRTPPPRVFQIQSWTSTTGAAGSR